MSAEPRRLGKYELRKRIAHGGMGEVWLAFDTQLQRPVAIKLLLGERRQDAEFVQRFEREAQLIASLRHPNIIQIHDFHVAPTSEEEHGPAYMAMDYVPGQTLSDYMRATSRRGEFPPAEDIVYLFTKISLGLDYAHRKGMVHRDIKPANILLDKRLPTPRPMGEPILTDFGIARLQGVSTGTMTGALLGTPMYISPEQVQGQQGEKRSDLYSLGILLYELMTGVTPFRGATTMAILLQHVNEPPTPPILINPSMPPELSEVILQSIAKRPEDRFSSALAMAVAVAQALNMPVPSVLLDATGQRPSNPGFTPLAMSSPVLTATQLAQPEPQPLQLPTTAHGNAPAVTTTPTYSTYQPTHTGAFSTTPPATLSKPEPAQHRSPLRRASYVVVPLLLVLALITSGIIFYKQNTSDTSTPQLVGKIQFSRSPGAPAQSYNRLQLNLQQVSPPPENYTYYGWIVAGSSESVLPYWKLPFQNGRIVANDLSFHDQNLLLPNTTFLITKEDTRLPPPVVPFTDPSSRVYYAQIKSSNTTAFDVKACPTTQENNPCLYS